jgi:hypothetical protein
VKRKIYWNEADFEELAKLNVNHFRGNKDCGPWEKLQNKFIELYDDKARDIYTRLYLRREEYDKIAKNVIKWAKKYHPHYSKKQLDMAVGLYDLNWSPCCFNENPSWSKKGVFYIKRKETK